MKSQICGEFVVTRSHVYLPKKELLLTHFSSLSPIVLSKGLRLSKLLAAGWYVTDPKGRGNGRLPPSALVSFFSPAGITVSFLFSTPLDFLTAKAAR